ncbi:hypothetical protein [Cellulomonas sp. HD19AZ1]|uniref:hypothetical protein n=1 Tax=Cellulomonas sp. HD19AZ1 TaxID=2559593 RepID=UPI001071101E|nr:hypothetical protein [Cellulomonas sp. HD19AZ1]TFH68130.1 hypothetical protein E4A51_17960 [Cellulomonas sp. HD19AZ1]
MLPFTNQIELNLRARVDDYAARENAKVVDILDQALRLALDVWEGKVVVVDGADDEAGRQASRG